MTFNDLKRLIVTFWPKKMAQPSTDLKSAHSGGSTKVLDLP